MENWQEFEGVVLIINEYLSIVKELIRIDGLNFRSVESARAYLTGNGFEEKLATEYLSNILREEIMVPVSELNKYFRVDKEAAMAGYSSDRDKQLQSFKRKTWGLTRLQVTAHSYNSKEPKIQITRQIRSDEETEEWTFMRLGRLDAQEIKWLAKIFRKEVLPWFDEFFAKRGGE